MYNELMKKNQYWLGKTNLNDGIPWLVPGAVSKLEKILQPSFRVLEFGSGGSTLFFSHRCKDVISIENNPKWYDKVLSKIMEQKIKNCKLILCPDISDTKNILKDRGLFDCILIDMHGEYRDRLLKISLPFMRSCGILVLDNYAAKKSFPESFALSAVDFVDRFLNRSWSVEEYNDKHWDGKGTRIIHNLCEEEK